MADPKRPQEMTTAELRQELTRLDQRFDKLSEQYKTAPTSELKTLNAEKREILGQRDEFDRVLAARLVAQRQRGGDWGEQTTPAPNSRAPSQQDPAVQALDKQAATLRQEWRHDLQAGTKNTREVDLYYAGRLDQHNSTIQMVGNLKPEMRESLPQRLDFAAVRNQIQQELSLSQKTEQKSSLAMAF